MNSTSGRTRPGTGRRSDGHRRVNRLRPSVETLEGRRLLTRSTSALLPTLIVVPIRTSQASGQSVSLHAFSLNGALPTIPTSYEFQARSGRSGPWLDVAPPSSAPSVSLNLSPTARLQFRVKAKILVDTDLGLDGGEQEDGFDDVIDLSASPLSPERLAAAAPFARGDFLMTFTSRAVALAGAPEAKLAQRTDSMTLISRRTVAFRLVSETVDGKQVTTKVKLEQNKAFFKQALDDKDREGAPNKLESEPVNVQRFSIVVRKGKKLVREENPDESRAVVFRTADGKKISAILVMKVAAANQNEVLAFQLITNDPTDPIDPKDFKVPFDTVRATGESQDVTSLLFPIYEKQVPVGGEIPVGPPVTVNVTVQPKTP